MLGFTAKYKSGEIDTSHDDEVEVSDGFLQTRCRKRFLAGSAFLSGCSTISGATPRLRLIPGAPR